ncbi:hypothetical protein AGDE_06349 [Angomonas deanei]|uniref:Uncharacterized protein n=1 Tax=Angomonas deanei TaxID=59799 RepID=A0A7G2CTJ9_9TRYP|nr:hypothetical protein AGDE_06349 [Angomonas deanei]CAD2221763.1 hypothetical protein, conserved [Angomonas deanei]|eukprot:EPY37585.1 hypothetical protein AGDE_06349 [Angomonas deanei]
MSTDDNSSAAKTPPGRSPPSSVDKKTPVEAVAPPPQTVPAGSGAFSDPLESIRETEEYRAAWDLELWKGIQADLFSKNLEKQKKKATADLHRLIQAKAKEHQAALAQRTVDLDHREEKVRLGEEQLVQRQQRLAEMEKDLRRTRQQLSDAQRRVEEEVRAQVRRANEDIAHKAKLLQERVLAAEEQTKKAEERQRQSHNEYLQLYESFNRFRTEQLSANQEITSGSRVFQDMQAQLQIMRSQHAEEQRLQLEKLEQKHQSQLREVLQRNKELEEQNRRLSLALARRREQLRQVGKDDSGEEGTRTTRSKERQSSSEDPAAPAALSPRVVEWMQELYRLRRERVSLVDGSAGAVSPSDGVIVRIDNRIREIEYHLSHSMKTDVNGVMCA